MSEKKINFLPACTYNLRPYIFLFLVILAFPLWLGLVFPQSGPRLIISLIVFFITSLVIIQSLLFLYATIFAWIEPDQVLKTRSPKKFVKPKLSFTALIPARHEQEVIADTIKAVAGIDYPEDKKEVLVICRVDDLETIRAAKKQIKLLGRKNIRLITFDGYPINKPKGLNEALTHATKDVLVIFDAEDEPHKNIFNIVNTVMQKDKADVVQSGVQLVNYRSSWFSTLNILEYFFWFKSALHFFNFMGVTPLGGNTVFLKKRIIEEVGGWDEEALTEDAQIGLNLSKKNAKISIVYDARHATQEETPPDVFSFIKQRTRWNQGFLQIFFKGGWLNIKGWCRKFMAAYLLAWPEVQALYFLYIPFSLFSMFFIDMPVWLALYSIIPLFLFLFMFVILNVGLYEFTIEYGFYYPWWMPLKLLITYLPYQFLLGISALRAVLRLIMGNLTWEKTQHINEHRQLRLGSD